MGDEVGAAARQEFADEAAEAVGDDDRSGVRTRYGEGME